MLNPWIYSGVKLSAFKNEVKCQSSRYLGGDGKIGPGNKTRVGVVALCRSPNWINTALNYTRTWTLIMYGLEHQVGTVITKWKPLCQGP